MGDYDPLPYCRSAFSSHLSLLVQPSAAIALSFLPASNHLLANVYIQWLSHRSPSFMSPEEDFVQVKARRNADTRRPQDSHRVLVRLFSSYPIDSCC